MGMLNTTNINTENWNSLSIEDQNYARGLWGEFTLNRALNVELGAVRYGEHVDGHSVFLFDRIHIPSYNGKTTEIDSVLVSQKGVFCFEVKSWSGEAVFGERDSSEWFTAKSKRSGAGGLTSHRMGNPFNQNDHHARYLKQLLPPIVAQQAFFTAVMLINASPFEVSPGNWAGGEIDDLFTDAESIVEFINEAPIIMSGKRVYEVAETLSQFPFGREFRALGSGFSIPNF